ncbi:MAG: hypothetical protein IJW20_02975 [Clostridia bacterium]|nr:hypothetical protein [Clostridia bacterium]
MLDKIKKIFTNKDKKIENLVSFLIILIITLIVINKILEEEENVEADYQNQTGVELASEELSSSETIDNNDLEKRLENILSKISGVGNVSVLLTYTQTSSRIPIYNINSSVSTIEEKDTSGVSKVTETENMQKEVISDNDSGIVTEKIVMPVVEGAIITAEGASNSNVKSNIIAAVEAVTGVATHKIQVFEMEE